MARSGMGMLLWDAGQRSGEGALEDSSEFLGAAEVGQQFQVNLGPKEVV